MKTVCLALVVALLLASLPPACMYQKVTLQSKTKSLSEHFTRAKQEREFYRLQGSSSDPHRMAIGFEGSHYVGNLTVGTPPQNFSVLMNTMVTGLWLPSALCPQDKYDMCKDHRQYDRNTSTTYISDGQAVALVGMSAELSIDTVSLADLNIANQSFAEVMQYNWSYSPVTYDGLLGLGLSQYVFTNHSPIFANMVTQQLIDEAVYGMYFIKNTSDTRNAGGLIIGGRNESLYVGDLTYVNSLSTDAWQFIVKRIVLLQSRDMPPLCPDGCKAVPNSASRFIATSHRTMDILHRHLGAIVFRDDYTYQFNCSSLSRLQPVYMSIGEAIFKIPWQSYVDEMKGSKGESVCVSTFVGLDDIAGYDWYFGEAFFASVYVEFDADKLRMGFAQSIYSY